MDNITHTLVGVALARAGFQRVIPRATLLLILAANFPDIDVLSLGFGQLAYLENHRGYTHTFLALPVLALICVGLTALIGKRKLPVMKAWAAACVGVGSHLLLDWTNSYGVRPLLPFSSRWFYLDLNGLYDGVILMALGFALVWPLFVNLVSVEIGGGTKQTGRGSAIGVLLFILLFDCGRWSLHQGVLNLLNSRMYNGEAPVDVAALPESNNPFEWTGIVETESAFRIVKAGPLDLDSGSDARVFVKPQINSAYRAAMDCEPFRYMAYFSRFPVWEFDPVALGAGEGTLVDLTDLRFGTPGKGGFHASALLDVRGNVLKSDFGFTTDKLRAMSAERQR
jgi:inner membrane protein